MSFVIIVCGFFSDTVFGSGVFYLECIGWMRSGFFCINFVFKIVFFISVRIVVV